MARFTRMEIRELCKSLENDANNIVSLHPAIAGRLKTATLLLRLTIALAEIEEVETEATHGVISFPMVQRH